MKRYVKEFIHDEINAIKPWAYKEPQKGAIEELKRVLQAYERGYITSLEAIKRVVELHYEGRGISVYE